MSTGALNRPDTVELTMRSVLGPSAASGSHPFPALLSDGLRWHVKVADNAQGPRIMVTEYLVCRAGELIDAPVCTVRPVSITAEFVGTQVQGGPVLSEGIASGSQHIEDVAEMRPNLDHRSRDDNARRHARIIAFYDWCWGDDPQWLVTAADDFRIHSHDHGFYLPPGRQNWSSESLVANVGIAHPLPTPSEGLDQAELELVAAALRAVDDQALRLIIESVPAQWPVADDELFAVSSYLHERAPQVADRIEHILETLPTP